LKNYSAIRRSEQHRVNGNFVLPSDEALDGKAAYVKVCSISKS
jgi:hypothetical protein